MNTKFFSNKQEKEVAKKFGGRKQLNSGALPFSKGDVITESFLIECKTTTAPKKSFSIKREWLDKLKGESLSMRKPYSVLAFNYEPNGKNYYVIDETLMKMLISHVAKILMKLLNSLTTKELKDNIDDYEFREELGEQLLNFCGWFVKKYPLYNLEIEDYSQELFLHMWERLDKFDSERGSLTTFSFTCCYNWFKMYLRKNKEVVYSLNMNLNNFSDYDGNNEIIDSLEDDEKLVLDKLCEDEFFEKAFNLCDEILLMSLNGMTQKEISKVTGYSQGYISRLVRSNIKKIKTELKI